MNQLIIFVFILSIIPIILGEHAIDNKMMKLAAYNNSDIEGRPLTCRDSYLINHASFWPCPRETGITYGYEIELDAMYCKNGELHYSVQGHRFNTNYQVTILDPSKLPNVAQKNKNPISEDKCNMLGEEFSLHQALLSPAVKISSENGVGANLEITQPRTAFKVDQSNSCIAAITIYDNKEPPKFSCLITQYEDRVARASVKNATSQDCTGRVSQAYYCTQALSDSHTFYALMIKEAIMPTTYSYDWVKPSNQIIVDVPTPFRPEEPMPSSFINFNIIFTIISIVLCISMLS